MELPEETTHEDVVNSVFGNMSQLLGVPPKTAAAVRDVTRVEVSPRTVKIKLASDAKKEGVLRPAVTLDQTKNFLDKVDALLDEISGSESDQSSDDADGSDDNTFVTSLKPTRPPSAKSQMKEQYFGRTARSQFFHTYQTLTSGSASGRPNTPRSRYLKNCGSLGITPVPLLDFRRLVKSKTDRSGRVSTADTHSISYRGRGIGNNRTRALAPALVNTPVDIHSISFEDNGLSAVGSEAILRSLCTSAALQHLDLSRNSLSRDGGATLATLLRSRANFPSLTSLNLASNRLGDAAAATVIDAICSVTESAAEAAVAAAAAAAKEAELQAAKDAARDADPFASSGEEEEGAAGSPSPPPSVGLPLCTLNLSNNKLGVRSGRALSHLLQRSRHLSALDVSWNALRHAAAAEVVESLAVSRSLTRLSLAHNNCGGAGVDVMLAAALRQSSCLAELDLSHNRLSERGCELLLDAMARGGTLERLDLSGNRVGATGGRVALRLIMNSSTPVRHTVTMTHCDYSSAPQEELPFDLTAPHGSYTLELDSPYDRMVAQQLMDLAEKEGRAAWCNVSITGRRLPDHWWQEMWQLPASGQLCFDYVVDCHTLRSRAVLAGERPPPSVLAAQHDSSSDSDGDDRRLGSSRRLRRKQSSSRRRRRPQPRGAGDGDGDGSETPSERKSRERAPLHSFQFANLLRYCALPCFAKRRDDLCALLCLAYDYRYRAAQVSQLLALFHDEEQRWRVVAALYPSIMDDVEARYALLNQLSGYGFRRVTDTLGFNPKNPAGHYRLTLSDAVQYRRAKALLLLNHVERRFPSAAAASGHHRPVREPSQHQTGDVLRNTAWDGQAFVYGDGQWNLPRNGTLEMDVLCMAALRDDAARADDVSFRRLEKLIKTTGVTYRRGGRGDGGSALSLEASRLRALRLLSADFTVTAAQARVVVEKFKDSGSRVEAMVLLFSRIQDLQNLGGQLWAAFTPAEHATLRRRIGHLHLLQPLHPHGAYSLDLAVAEERRVATFLLRLDALEPGGRSHCRDIVLDGGRPLQEVPKRWVADCPSKGRLQLTYRGEKATATGLGGGRTVADMRRALATELLGWEFPNRRAAAAAAAANPLMNSKFEARVGARRRADSKEEEAAKNRGFMDWLRQQEEEKAKAKAAKQKAEEALSVTELAAMGW